MLFKWSPIGDSKNYLDGFTSINGSEHRFSTGTLLCRFGGIRSVKGRGTILHC